MSSTACQSNSSPKLQTTGRVLVVDDHAPARESILLALRHAGHYACGCASGAEALERLQEEPFDVVITDLQMPGMDGLELIRTIQRRRIGTQVVMITAHASVATAVEAMRHGALDYIEKPFDVAQLEALVRRAVERAALLDGQHLEPPPAEGEQGAVLVGSSQVMQQLRRRVAQVAPTPETVLITGESGTGKELVAQLIHQWSDRAARPMIKVNCPALPAQLVESELFGHTRGAFTGADAPRKGRFELAHESTLLLDEVTETDLALQAKLLRVLQQGEIQPVGSDRTLVVDVRVLATTNRNLREEVRQGRFRQDLFYRLNVLPLAVPPLRQRREDVPELVEHFTTQAARRLGRDPVRLAPCAQQLLQEYHWPGNVRELENLIKRATVLDPGRPYTADDLRPWLIDPEGDSAERLQVPVGVSLQEMERRLIEATLAHFGGHRRKTAEALGIGLRTLTGKLKSYGLTGSAARCTAAPEAA